MPDPDSHTRLLTTNKGRKIKLFLHKSSRIDVGAYVYHII